MRGQSYSFSESDEMFKELAGYCMKAYYAENKQQFLAVLEKLQGNNMNANTCIYIYILKIYIYIYR
jgi:hypothetical protein